MALYTGRLVGALIVATSLAFLDNVSLSHTDTKKTNDG
jgi:hypothetical protein